MLPTHFVRAHTFKALTADRNNGGMVEQLDGTSPSLEGGLLTQALGRHPLDLLENSARSRHGEQKEGGGWGVGGHGRPLANVRLRSVS